MKLDTFYNQVDLYRKEKIVYAHFLKPHRTLATGRMHGGVHETLDYLINHQCCEPTKHSGIDLFDIIGTDPARYLKRITSKAGIESQQAAILNTAANMNNSAIQRAEYDGLEVVAVCTAGVGSNAGRAGDPASYQQTAEGYKPCGLPAPKAGTMITMLFINQELTPGALVVAATVATEAKSALLQELTAPSRYAGGIATGTGTDQIGIAALIATEVCHNDANKHCKLGELIGIATRGALQQALNLQCGMTPDSRRSSIIQLERFGETQEAFQQAIAARLPEAMQALFNNNFLSVNHDPVTVAAVQACVHLKDQINWGVLPKSCAKESLLYQAGLIARAVSGKQITPETFLNDWNVGDLADSNADFLQLIHQAFAHGFALKWQGRFED
jgi:adenosylcobinamide amidohydrolase